MYKGTRKYGYRVHLSCLGFLFWIFFDASAQGFYRASGPNIPTPESNFVRYSFGPIDESSFLYGVTKIKKYTVEDKSFSQTIYRYDVEKHISIELISLDFNSADFSPSLVTVPEFIRFETGSKKSYIIASGRLLVTDGTPVGTQVLRDFGTRYCCGNGSQMSRIYPLVLNGDDLYFEYENEIDASHPYFQSIVSFSIWKTDGTPSGTKQVSRRFSDFITTSYPIDVFVNRNVDLNNAFYFAKGGIWKTGVNTSLPFIKLDADHIEAFFDPYLVIASIRTGNFLCGLNYDKTGKALWRFSNSGKFEVIADGCDSIWSFGDRLFFKSGNEIWGTDGSSLGERLLFKYNGNLDSSVCQIGEEIYFVFDKYPYKNRQIFQVNKQGEVFDRSQELSVLDGFRTNSCSQKHIFFEPGTTSNLGSSPVLFEPKNGKIVKLLNYKNSGQWVGKREGATLLYRYSYRPIFLSKTVPPSFPSTLMMMFEDQ